MKNKKVKLIINIASWVLLGVIVVFAVINIVLKSTNQVFFLFGRANLFVVTDSMEPTIPARTYIGIEKVSPEDIKPEDVITFYSEDPTIYGNLNTHRVKDIKTDANGKLVFYTKGDNNSVADSYPVPENKLVGRYTGNLAFMTFLGRFFMSTGGLIVILFLIIIMAVYMILPMFKKKPDEKQTAVSEEEKQKLIEEMVKAEIEKLKKSQANKEKTSTDDDKTETPTLKE